MVSWDAYGSRMCETNDSIWWLPWKRSSIFNVIHPDRIVKREQWGFKQKESTYQPEKAKVPAALDTITSTREGLRLVGSTLCEWRSLKVFMRERGENERGIEGEGERERWREMEKGREGERRKGEGWKEGERKNERERRGKRWREG